MWREDFAIKPKDNSQLFYNFFQDLFTSSLYEGIEDCLLSLNNKVKYERNARLIQEFTVVF